jgi:hypothetical protein
MASKTVQLKNPIHGPREEIKHIVLRHAAAKSDSSFCRRNQHSDQLGPALKAGGMPMLRMMTPRPLKLTSERARQARIACSRS